MTSFIIIIIIIISLVNKSPHRLEEFGTTSGSGTVFSQIHLLNTAVV